MGEKEDDEKQKDVSCETQPSPWTPEAVEQVIRLVDSLAKDYLQFRREDSEAKLHRLEAISAHNRRLIYWMIGFLAIVISLTGVLAFFGRASGDAFFFIIGTLTGYIIVIIQQFIASPVEKEEVKK
ncbi:MAG: hypothetical protein ACP5ID_05670 [Conexivisphaera sp.]|jgi:hypothetical protein